MTRVVDGDGGGEDSESVTRARRAAQNSLYSAHTGSRHGGGEHKASACALYRVRTHTVLPARRRRFPLSLSRLTHPCRRRAARKACQLRARLERSLSLSGVSIARFDAGDH